jgi:hypothetical protein
MADGFERLRLDVMTTLRGVDDFPGLWDRRTELIDESGAKLHLLSIADLVNAKKTQRDKDWPMIRLLIERHFRENAAAPTEKQIEFWLSESRTPAMLVYFAKRYPTQTADFRKRRPLLVHAESGDESGLARELDLEMTREREADRIYWPPLKKELEGIRKQLVEDRRQDSTEL